MPNQTYELNGVRVLQCASEGAEIKNGHDAADLVAAAFEQRARCIAIPVARLGADFFQLRTGVAGDIVQKIVNYRMRLVIVSDISRYIKASPTLRDFVREANRGNQIWFVTTPEEPSGRLRAIARSTAAERG